MIYKRFFLNCKLNHVKQLHLKTESTFNDSLLMTLIVDYDFKC